MKWVSPNGPSDLAGLLPGDHVLQVDDVMVFEESHHKVYSIYIILSDDDDDDVIII